MPLTQDQVTFLENNGVAPDRIQEMIQQAGGVVPTGNLPQFDPNTPTGLVTQPPTIGGGRTGGPLGAPITPGPGDPGQVGPDVPRIDIIAGIIAGIIQQQFVNLLSARETRNTKPL